MNEEVKRKMRIRGGGKDEMRWEFDDMYEEGRRAQVEEDLR